jgi:SAM-dependent methyltransferase
MATVEMLMGGGDEHENTRELRRAYGASTPEELAAYYDGWSRDYEAHMRNVGYAHPAMVAALLARHLPAGSGPVLDAGAGTGIMGDLLEALGYPELVGFDASSEMLVHAAKRDRYRELHRMFLGRPLDFPDDGFAAVVASGVFTEGHAPLSGLDELARVTRPGGPIVLSVARIYLEGPFDEKVAALAETGRCRLADASERYNSTPLEDEIPARVYVLEVL